MQATIYSMKTALSYFKMKFFINGVLYKHGAMSASALTAATGLTLINLNDNYFGLSLMLILIYCTLTILDSFTGIIASRHSGNKIESGKLIFTFYKFLFTFLFFWLLDSLQAKLSIKISSGEYKYLLYFLNPLKEGIEIVTYSVFMLLTFREWLSIGENLQKRFNKKIYLFTIVEKLFDIVERKLLTWLDKSTVYNPKDESNV